MKSKLYYDASCPICMQFIKMVRNKVSLEELHLIPINNNEATEFKYEDKNGKTFNGTSAVTRFSEEYPSILSYFWMLPSKFQATALNAVYKVGTAVRSVIKKDCNCGKK